MLASLSPPSPSLVIRIRCPFSTPAGIFTGRVFPRRLVLAPLHSLQARSGTFPAPSHSSQVLTVCIAPKIVRLEDLICPVPWHFGQVEIFDPGSPPVP